MSRTIYTSLWTSTTAWYTLIPLKRPPKLQFSGDIDVNTSKSVKMRFSCRQKKENRKKQDPNTGDSCIAISSADRYSLYTTVSLQWAGSCPKLPLLLKGSGPCHLAHGSLDAPESMLQMALDRIGSSVFVGLPVVTNRHTHMHRDCGTSVTIGRILCFAQRCSLIIIEQQINLRDFLLKRRRVWSLCGY